ncbi:uncharacterized protein LOC129753232 [Uranotaenia lowii]|uniref:uncharacterized protein LOC129753232 n=1 Tax=Uranotaenia lowii TaxID=190385 RepID=UPI00247A2438|nr:uncharacterized protein LOC129753232 [Uranotaenia lowii]
MGDDSGGGPSYGSGSRFWALGDDADTDQFTNVAWKRKRGNKRPVTRDVTSDHVFQKQLKFDPKDNGGRFLIVTRTDEKKDMTELNPFWIKKCIDNISKGIQISRFKQGTLLLKTLNRQQAEKVLKATTFCEGVNIKVTEHESMNISKGTIFCPDLNKMKDEEILEWLVDSNVKEVKRIQRKNSGGKLEDTGSFILTFNLSYLPRTIDCGFYNCTVRMYVPNPMRCTVCLRFGHKKDSCKSNRICAACADLFHDKTPCQHPTTCVNCRGEHNALSRACPIYQDELEIQSIRVTDRVTMREARNKRRQQVPLSALTAPFQRSFAAVARNPPRREERTKTDASQQRPETSNEQHVNTQVTQQPNETSGNSTNEDDRLHPVDHHSLRENVPPRAEKALVPLPPVFEENKINTTSESPDPVSSQFDQGNLQQITNKLIEREKNESMIISENLSTVSQALKASIMIECLEELEENNV